MTFTAEFFGALRIVCSMVEHLTLEHDPNFPSSRWYDKVDRARWRDSLGSFSGTDSLLVGDGLVFEISRSLRIDDDESTMGSCPS